MHGLSVRLRPAMVALVASHLAWFTAACLLAGAYVRGTRLDADRSTIAYGFEVPTLRYGDRLPPFSLPDTGGQLWNNASLLGHWTLLSIGSSSCPSCREQWRELSTQAAAGDSYRTELVLSAGTVVGSFARACSDYRKEARIGLPMLLDENSVLARRVSDRSGRFPLAVLVDPHARVRFVAFGHRAGTLRDDIRQVLAGGALVVPPGLRPERLSADVQVAGRSRDFATLIRPGWSVVTVAAPGCPRCNLRLNALARFKFGPRMRCIVVVRSVQDAAQLQAMLGTLPIMVVADTKWRLAKQLGAHEVPSTYVTKGGGLVFTSRTSGPDLALWSVIGAALDGRVRSGHAPARQAGSQPAPAASSEADPTPSKRKHLSPRSVVPA